ncbi:MAG: UDP-2,3-diacylglucosamine diphosphatase [Bacteroidetes bacterium]|nr:UDP-2,3-diacylglucosamine diphosphatase [Bacteroidota bacterium]
MKSIAYFASDFHLGAPDESSTKEREQRVVAWLDFISKDATHLFLVGDLFDFWFEYKRVIPKGFIRIQAKIAQLVDKGIEVHLFRGNHDMWMFDYFEKELGVKIHADELEIELNQTKIRLAHGDGVGAGDRTYKIIKKIFRSKVSQWFFARIHPNFGLSLAQYFSKSSRKKTGHLDEEFKGLGFEAIYQYLKKNHPQLQADTYIFGHRHLPLQIKEENFQYINLGDWIIFNSYVKFSKNDWEFLQWKDNKPFPLTSSHI